MPWKRARLGRCDSLRRVQEWRTQGEQREDAREEARVRDLGSLNGNFRVLMQRPLTRRAVLSLLGAVGLGACVGNRDWSIVETFPERTVESPRPTVDLDTYRLVVDGLVRTPLNLTYEELLALPMASLNLIRLPP